MRIQRFGLPAVCLLLLTLGVWRVAAQQNEALGAPPVTLSLPAPAATEAPTAPEAVIPQAYLPLVVVPEAGCQLSAEAQAIADLATGHPDQGRPTMICDPILAQVAYERALDMGQRAYFSHTNPDGHGPNYLVEQAGYTLPDWYGQALDANNIESIAAGYGTPDAAWTGWLNSSGHRAHVLAESSFWQQQTHYGIGHAYVPGSPYGHYWVFLSAPPQP